jgi:small subunit ribosomal protein S1
VSGYNRGGLLAGGEGLHGFVPVSHLVDFDCLAEENQREDILEGYVGKEISLKVIECDEERGRVVFSERAALAASGMRNQLFVTLKPGDRICGVVTNITEFGVFVDLGGIEGLIHVSELSWGRVRHPGDVVKIGDQVGAYVIQVDRNKSRIALSIKRLRANPWETAEERYRPGDVVEAFITSVVPYGAFARLEEGLDGLIHSTEFGVDDAGNSLAHHCQEGQTILVRVINVDAARQRLGLSLKIDDW